MTPLGQSWRKRLAIVIPKMILAAGAVVAVAAVLAVGLGPRSLHGWGEWIVVGSFVLLTVGTAAIYGAELRRVNMLRFSWPISRSGLPPEDELEEEEETDAAVEPDVYVEERPPRLRAMIPVFVTFLVTFALGLALAQT